MTITAFSLTPCPKIPLTTKSAKKFTLKPAFSLPRLSLAIHFSFILAVKVIWDICPAMYPNKRSISVMGYGSNLKCISDCCHFTKFSSLTNLERSLVAPPRKPAFHVTSASPTLVSVISPTSFFEFRKSVGCQFFQPWPMQTSSFLIGWKYPFLNFQSMTHGLTLTSSCIAWPI